MAGKQLVAFVSSKSFTLFILSLIMMELVIKLQIAFRTPNIYSKYIYFGNGCGREEIGRKKGGNNFKCLIFLSIFPSCSYSFI